MTLFFQSLAIFLAFSGLLDLGKFFRKKEANFDIYNSASSSYKLTIKVSGVISQIIYFLYSQYNLRFNIKLTLSEITLRIE